MVIPNLIQNFFIINLRPLKQVQGTKDTKLGTLIFADYIGRRLTGFLNIGPDKSALICVLIFISALICVLFCSSFLW